MGDFHAKENNSQIRTRKIARHSLRIARPAELSANTLKQSKQKCGCVEMRLIRRLATLAPFPGRRDDVLNIAFVLASCILLMALALTAIAVNQLLKLLREQLLEHPLGSWLANHESSLILSVWAALIAALFFFGPRLVMLITEHVNTRLG